MADAERRQRVDDGVLRGDEFVESDDGTLVRVIIEVFGPLAFLWGRIVARKQAADAAGQTVALVRFAAARS